MEQLDEVTFAAGDQILFKRGQYHFGNFKVRQSGEANNPIYIDAYGDGNMPLLKSKDIDYMRAFDITGPDFIAQNNVFRNNVIRNQSVTSHLHGNNNTN